MRIVLTLLSTIVALALPSVAGAASVAYIENGEVWVSSLDGAQKARLAAPVVNSEGITEMWLAVAASDNGRVVAARNVPGRNAGYSWFKVWEPNGTSTVEGPLNYPGGWAVVVYPLGFDITADGQHMVYGFSNSGFCCPISFSRGTYVRPVTNSVLPPIAIAGYEEPTLFGSRVIARSGTTVYAQREGTSTYGDEFDGWLNLSGPGLDVRRTDVAANATLAAFELEQWQGGGQTVGKIGLISTDAAGNLPGPVDCFLPAVGIAKDVSLSQDGGSVAWTDGQGLKVAGTPVDADDPCTLSRPPVVISASGTSASIGGGDVAAFLPPAPPVVVPVPGATPGPGGGIAPPMTATNPAAPTLVLPAKVTAKALSAGLTLKVGVAAAGKVTVSATVGGKKVGSGTATAKRAGQLTVKLKLTKAGRKLARKGKTLKLTITQAGRTTTRTIKLR